MLQQICQDILQSAAKPEATRTKASPKPPKEKITADARVEAFGMQIIHGYRYANVRETLIVITSGCCITSYVAAFLFVL